MDDRLKIEHEDLKKAVAKEKDRAVFWAKMRKSEYFAEFMARLAAERDQLQMSLRTVGKANYENTVNKLDERDILLGQIDREGGDSKLAEASRRLREFEARNALFIAEGEAEEEAGEKVKGARKDAGKSIAAAAGA
jgi:hypothetical protein